MPRSPLNNPILVVKRNLFRANPKIYLNTNGHSGIDIWSPLGEDWFACVPGVVHLFNRFVWQWGLGLGDPSYSRYGAGMAIDWGQTDGFIRIIYGHGRNRRKELDNRHVPEGKYMLESGNTGFSSGPHQHFEMRRFLNSNIGKFYDGLVKRRYDLLDPKKEFLVKYKIPYTLA